MKFYPNGVGETFAASAIVCGGCRVGGAEPAALIGRRWLGQKGQWI
jgi:hypothetical protein